MSFLTVSLGLFHSLTDGEKPDNPLNEFATDMSLSEVDRIKKYAMSTMLVQRYVVTTELHFKIHLHSRNQALLR